MPPSPDAAPLTFHCSVPAASNLIVRNPVAEPAVTYRLPAASAATLMPAPAPFTTPAMMGRCQTTSPVAASITVRKAASTAAMRVLPTSTKCSAEIERDQVFDPLGSIRNNCDSALPVASMYAPPSAVAVISGVE